MCRLKLNLVSPDGEEGFPGTMEVKVTYSLTDKNELIIEYCAITDRPTVINLTNDTYFNFTGSATNSILDYILMINADKYITSGSPSVHAGEILNVDNTPWDFRKPQSIGKYIDKLYEDVIFNGYDHKWTLNSYSDNVRKAVELYEPSTGRFMEIFTDQPGLQFYSGSHLDGTITGKGGIRIEKMSGLCLECKHYPDSPNHSGFPSVVLRPGEIYKKIIIYKFSVRT